MRSNRSPPAEPNENSLCLKWMESEGVCPNGSLISSRESCDCMPAAPHREAAKRQPDLKQMMVWGNLIDAESAAQQGGVGDPEAPSWAPYSWQLVRQSVSGRNDVLSKGVLSFDIAGVARCFIPRGAPFIALRQMAGGLSASWSAG
jgi:hypothetical protein